MGLIWGYNIRTSIRVHSLLIPCWALGTGREVPNCASGIEPLLLGVAVLFESYKFGVDGCIHTYCNDISYDVDLHALRHVHIHTCMYIMCAFITFMYNPPHSQRVFGLLPCPHSFRPMAAGSSLQPIGWSWRGLSKRRQWQKGLTGS